jgi:prevent-host-death family protein
VADQQKAMKKVTLSATEFRSSCHRLLDDVAKGAYSIVITKRGKPVARVEAIRSQAGQGPLKGRWAGLGKTKGDIFTSTAARTGKPCAEVPSKASVGLPGPQ